MNKKQVIFSLIIFLLFVPKISFCAGGKSLDIIEWNNMQEVVFKVDPKTISEEQFYMYEEAILRGYSGSGGYFLDDSQISWLQRVEAALTGKGLTLKDEWNRGFVIADSYINSNQYEKALKEFQKLKQQDGIELAEWLLKNGSIKEGKVSLAEYPGAIPNEQCGEPKVENERYVFEGCFKGPVYRYDKVIKKHAIIYMPKDKYDWCDKLTFDGKIATITLRDGAGTFQFDNDSTHISSESPVTIE